MTAPRHTWLTVRDGREKTQRIYDRILEGALDPAVRDIAVRLVQMVDRNDHLERLARLHRFVRDAVSYQREPVEQLQAAPWTLEHGGDCDCLTILLGALAWSLRYPFDVSPHGDSRDPEHYSLSLGWPASDEFSGDESTQWIHAEVSAAALLGESTESAALRGAPL